eukprot:CAMPEP_0184312386 /NCGR_PEP_ID=MMETSP1049-20130417/49751_1 /TAXON_ID=77928 /ORGANISM="Proteomonas sulcata, Strain CCMP704" /LENGTH=128 /DNA_ID=CAMNT_0026628509 /DNA_START=204 /DNA_END=587 /DNA_ORIENTATION=+
MTPCHMISGSHRYEYWYTFNPDPDLRTFLTLVFSRTSEKNNAVKATAPAVETTTILEVSRDLAAAASATFAIACAFWALNLSSSAPRRAVSCECARFRSLTRTTSPRTTTAVPHITVVVLNPCPPPSS